MRSAAVKYRDPQNGDAGASRSLTDKDDNAEIVEEIRQVTTVMRTGTGGGRGNPRDGGGVGRDGGTLPGGRGGMTTPSPIAPPPPPPKKYPIRVVWRNGLRRMLRTEDNKRVSVPITVSVMVLSSYILSGAVLFTLWEEDWDYLIGSYFCFITLTTIGFGDFVPGTSSDSWANQEKLVLCALYLLFGLALIAMCFDLMQEEARNMVRALGVKLGIVEKEKKLTPEAT